MLGIHPSIASHRPNIMPSSRPVHQKVRHFHPNKQRIIQSEVDKSLTTRFIKEVEYPDWLANMIMDPHFLCPEIRLPIGKVPLKGNTLLSPTEVSIG
ncbi:hypothetical protein CK203_026559 [Vitis vinifera]|uniref:Uncharacterized protein n=1 Tax=Vitis vinifera TaxID=29760 RepID=A0A438IW48_VITVI|nr:hypothetical protein CK203_026559 [Vitis vinifera]